MKETDKNQQISVPIFSPRRAFRRFDGGLPLIRQVDIMFLDMMPMAFLSRMPYDPGRPPEEYFFRSQNFTTSSFFAPRNLFGSRSYMPLTLVIFTSILAPVSFAT